jgi:hypothetical protein
MNDISFYGRDLVIATMHGKEAVIAPLLAKELGVRVITASGLNTDSFGTFSGEIERSADPVTAARLKCCAAGELYNCSLAVASEGSFGPHPSLFFVPADEEIIVLKDFENDLEIKSRVLTTETNFNGRLVHSWEEAVRFADDVRFPTHGLIVRRQQQETEDMVKGITDRRLLEKTVERLIGLHGHAFLETDMRAMYNPTRMKVIGQATQKLCETVKRKCPSCFTPGFDITSAIEGLPCERCGAPTRSTLAYVYACVKCDHREEQKFPHDKHLESPMYCDWCNP